MILLGIYAVAFLVYFASPLPIRLLFLLINFFFPDPIPILDEVIMLGGIVSKMLFLERITDFISEHKILSALIGMAVVLVIWSLFQ